MVGFADTGHVKGCVIQVTVPRYVKPDVLVETFTQEQLDSFFILVSLCMFAFTPAQHMS